MNPEREAWYGEWIAPDAMLNFLRLRRLTSDRKLRLFACACCRVNAAMADLSRHPNFPATLIAACARAERMADGGEPVPEWLAERNSAWSVWRPDAMTAALECCLSSSICAAIVRDVFGSPFHRPPKLYDLYPDATEGGLLFRGPSDTGSRVLTPAVLSLADAAYAGRDFALFGLLADALEDAGCTTAALIGHLRGRDACWKCGGERKYRIYPKNQLAGSPPVYCPCFTCGERGWLAAPPHVLGCWAMDTILGKE